MAESHLNSDLEHRHGVHKRESSMWGGKMCSSKMSYRLDKREDDVHDTAKRYGWVMDFNSESPNSAHNLPYRKYVTHPWTSYPSPSKRIHHMTPLVMIPVVYGRVEISKNKIYNNTRQTEIAKFWQRELRVRIHIYKDVQQEYTCILSFVEFNSADFAR